MTSDYLHDRGKAMEEAFYREMDKKLIKDLKSRFQSEADRSELASATGIEDESVLNQFSRLLKFSCISQNRNLG